MSFAQGDVDHHLRLNIKAHDGEVSSVAISPDGKLVASGGLDGKIKIWDGDDGKLLQTLGENLEISTVAFSPDGERLLTASRDEEKNFILQTWDPVKGKLKETIKGHGQKINSAAYSPNGKMIASGSGDNTIRTWNSRNGRDIGSYKAGKNDVLSVNWSPDNDYIVSGVSWDGNILIVDASSDELVKTLPGHSNWVNTVLYTPDGKNIISGSKDGSVRIWDAKSGKEQKNIREWWWGEISQLAVTADGVLLAGATEKDSVVIWYVDGKVLDVLSGHSGRVNSVAFSLDGKIVVSGGNDGTIKIWATPGTGDARSLFELGGEHDKGSEQIKEDDKEAFKWYSKAADQGYTEAMARVGEMLAAGDGVKVDLDKAVKMLGAAADKGHIGAMYSLGNMYAVGKGVARDPNKSAELWASAAEKGHVKARMKLKNQAGGIDPESIDKASLEWVVKTAEGGDVKAQYSLGAVYRKGGKGIPQNRTKAVKWFKQAAKAGDVRSQYYLAESYELGQGSPSSPKEAMKWYKSAAEKGLGAAQFKLAGGYAKGVGVAKSTKDAVKWYRKAADQGNPEAMAVMAEMYKTGKGVKKSGAEVAKWLAKAAERGDVGAMYELGNMYSKGKGVKKNSGQAAKWFLAAAQRGNALAQLNVGLMYSLGETVKKDDTRASAW
ncbi:MAG: hypothetical protein ABFQ82_01950, partial [Thermodesulfobacteriota bacterium]